VNRQETEETEEGGGAKIPPPQGDRKIRPRGKGGTGAAHLRAGEQWRATTVFLPSSLSYLLPAARLPPIIVVREREESALLGARPGRGQKMPALQSQGLPLPLLPYGHSLLSAQHACAAQTPQEGARERRN
jgi:hypothetical protein